jgi:glucose-6-phosphate-specific signal transduction histidine kinase
MFAIVTAVRFAVAGVGEPVTLLYVFPVALLATAFGMRGGIAGAAAGIALFTVWAGTHGQGDLTTLDWLTRAAPLALLGVLLGDAIDRLEASQRHAVEAEAIRAELAEAHRRHEAAVEINDSIVQGLVAAKWAVELGDVGRALEVLDATLDESQKLVTDLIRGTDPDSFLTSPEPRPAHH